MTEEQLQIIYDYLHLTYRYHEDGYFINKKTNKIVHGSLDMYSKKLINMIGFRIKGKNYHWSYGHAIYLYHNKIKPKFLLHINGNYADKRIENLKQSTKSQMMIERDLQVKNKHAIKGVIKDNKRYGARLWTGKTYKYLGWFYTPEEAGEAYIKAREEYKNETT